MNLRGCAIFTVLFGAWLPTSAEAQQWIPDLEQAQAKARAEHRLVLADFWADWCGPCRAMDVQTWEDPRVPDLAKRFVLARVDFGERGTSTSEYYSVNSIPTLMLLDHKGACLMRVMGFRSPLALIELLQRLPFQAAETESLSALASSSLPSVEASLDLATTLTNHKLFELSARVCKRARHLLEPTHPDSLDERLDLLAALNRIETDAGACVQGLRACLERYPRGLYRRDAHSSLVRALKLLGAQAGAEEALAHMQKEFLSDSLTASLGRFVAIRP